MHSALRHRLSLGLNVVLVLVVVAVLRHAADRPITSSASAPAVHPANKGADSLPPAPAERRYAERASATERRRWLIDQLRAAGVPNRVLGRVALADFEEEWQRRFEAGPGDAESMSARQLEQDVSKAAEMRAALGEADFKLWDQTNMLREAVPGKVQLTAVENDAIYELKKALQRRQWEVERARVEGKMDDPEITAAYDHAYSEFNRQMKSLLGEERYAQSQGLDAGTAAENLQRDLAKVAPSDSQLQQLLKAQQQWNERRAELDQRFQNDSGSTAYADQIKALDEAREQEYERVLGPGVFDQLQKDQDLRYSKMKKYGGIWGLDDTSIDYTYRAVRYYEKVVEDYRRQAHDAEAHGQPVDWTTVNATIRQFGQQSEQALQGYLGPDRFGKLQRNGVIEFNPTTLPTERPF